jgi:HSP20 family protein
MSRQALHVRVYQTDGRMIVAAPMPGLEPDDISVHIGPRRVVIRGRERGPHQHRLRLLRADWTVGPYYGEVELPEAVDGALTNVTYGNGVLVIVMPKTKEDTRGRVVEIRPVKVGPGRGEWVGHAGRVVRPVSNAEHLRKHGADELPSAHAT